MKSYKKINKIAKMAKSTAQSRVKFQDFQVLDLPSNLHNAGWCCGDPDLHDGQGATGELHWIVSNLKISVDCFQFSAPGSKKVALDVKSWLL